uniref:C2H2-type domain-containing protein n=1 Tax=Globodera pallida TaxID=36090 RepID=A0A183BHF2_GLOPA
MLICFCILNSPYWTGKFIANVINCIKEHRDRGDSFVCGSTRSGSGIVAQQQSSDDSDTIPTFVYEGVTATLSSQCDDFDCDKPTMDELLAKIEQMFNVNFRCKTCGEWFGLDALPRHWDSNCLSNSSPLQLCDQLNSSDSGVPSTSTALSNEVDNCNFICLDQSVLSMAEKAENLCAGFHAECVAAAEVSHLSELQELRDMMLLQCSTTDEQGEQNED